MPCYLFSEKCISTKNTLDKNHFESLGRNSSLNIVYGYNKSLWEILIVFWFIKRSHWLKENEQYELQTIKESQVSIIYTVDGLQGTTQIKFKFIFCLFSVPQGSAECSKPSRSRLTESERIKE